MPAESRKSLSGFHLAGVYIYIYIYTPNPFAMDGM